MRVSVIIPCYNAEPYLAQTIGSVLEQTRPAEEILLIDDGSTDRSAEIAARFGSPVQVVSRRCGGASKARNFGYSLASGDALMFLDADDVVGPTILEELTGTLSDAPTEIAVCPWYRLEKIDGKWVRRPPSCDPRQPEQDDLSAWLSRWYHPPCSVLWSRTAYERTGGWDQRAYVNDDGDIMMRALVLGARLVQSSGGEAFYRRLPDNPHSVSGARFTKEGRQSQIYVILKIAHMLEERQLLPQYHTAIAGAFERLALQCKNEYPDLYGQCMEYMRTFGNVSRVQAAQLDVKRKINHARWKLGRVADRLTSNSPSSNASDVTEPLEEIRYGLNTAEKAESGTRPETSTPTLTVPDQPVVSVVIPTYNRADLIGRALDSVLDQTFDDFEVLVIDDGSTDGTESVVADYGDQRVHYYQLPENRGVSAARNKGMREARGQFIAFLDSDDEWFPTKLEKQVNHFQQLPEEVGLLYCGVETVEDDGTSWMFLPQHRGNVYRQLLIGNVIHTGSGVMIRRDVIPAAGFFDEEIPAIEDYDYWLRIARYYEFDFVEGALVRYYHYKQTARKTSDVADNLDAYEWFFEKHYREMQRAGVTHLFFRECARRHLVAGRSDKEGVRPLAWRAVWWQPFRYDAYRFLLRTILPEHIFQMLRNGYGSIRQRINYRLSAGSTQDT